MPIENHKIYTTTRYIDKIDQSFFPYFVTNPTSNFINHIFNPMFDFLKKQPTDVKGIRSAILDFIKEQLQKAEGGEGGHIRGLTLYLTCAVAERHLYEAAVYVQDENRFKEEEIQKIADDYAIDLPATWTFEIAFVDNAPPEAWKAKHVEASLLISTNKKAVKVAVVQSGVAIIKVLNGEAENAAYTLEKKSGKINIGRDKDTTTADGFIRKNHIAFLSSSSNECNRSVSRQHAHIEWNEEAKGFFIFADEGGIPPYNKTKVKAREGVAVKLQTTQIGHRLQQGDQIVIGESAVLEFGWAK